jgi:hypothetical protein
MTNADQNAIEEFKRLPDAPRAELAALIVEYSTAWNELTGKLNRAAKQLKSGEGIPATKVFADLRARHGG